jgi:hypothetical protein
MQPIAPPARALATSYPPAWADEGCFYFSGRSAVTELYRNGVFYRTIANDSTYDYNQPKFWK